MGKKKKHPEDIRLTEKQVHEISDKCAKCHQSEYAKWLSGGHSANYADINSPNNIHSVSCKSCHFNTEIIGGKIYQKEKTHVQKKNS
ncbi:MAG: hypothetical protein Q7J86_09220 [Bacteroidota bacterium]|nr:hypothetical protein [Bacteroidota bacterium]